MIQNNTKLRVFDNSDASVVKCFKNLKFQNNLIPYQNNLMVLQNILMILQNNLMVCQNISMALQNILKKSLISY